MRIGVPLETAPRERRVALVPDSVARLRTAGLEVVVANEALLEVLERQLDVAASDAERVDIQLRTAVAWGTRFRKPERACEALERVLDIDDRNESMGLKTFGFGFGRDALSRIRLLRPRSAATAPSCAPPLLA